MSAESRRVKLRSPTPHTALLRRTCQESVKQPIVAQIGLRKQWFRMPAHPDRTPGRIPRPDLVASIARRPELWFEKLRLPLATPVLRLPKPPIAGIARGWRPPPRDRT